MKTVLIKLATLMAMVHMSLGCAWHHGLGHSSCESVEADSSASVCDHDHRRCHADHSDHEHAVIETTKFQSCDHGSCVANHGSCVANHGSCVANHGTHHDHAGCHDDGCHFIVAKTFDCNGLVPLHLYFGDVAAALIVSCNSVQLDRFNEFHPASAAFATGVRANLLLGVLIV